MDNKEKNCCFFGHREVTHNIREKLTAVIEKLITEDSITEFYVGHQGQFDSMVYSVLKELKAKYPQIRYAIVLAYMPDEHIIYLNEVQIWQSRAYQSESNRKCLIK